MLGGMLAGTRPTPGPVMSKKNKNGEEVKVKAYRGMASSEVQKDFHGGIAEWKTSEGISIPFREDEDMIINDIIGGLRSGLTYGGAATIAELQRKLDYIEITTSGRTEGFPQRLLY